MKLQSSYLSLICVLSANMTMALRPFEVTLDNREPNSYGEFGRSVKPKRRAAKQEPAAAKPQFAKQEQIGAKRQALKHEPNDADILYRELIEDVQFMAFSSMSMSMGMSTDDTVPATTETPQPTAAPGSPTGVPTAQVTQAPTDASATSASCSGEPQVLINVSLEVDTLEETTAIQALLADALVVTLSDEYSFCGRRRLEDGVSVVEDFQLGDITVTKDDNESCSPVNSVAGSCQAANASIVVSGEVDGAATKLRNSLRFLFENDAKFVEELPFSGVIEVRLKEGSEESEANSVPSELGASGQPSRSAVVAIISTAGLSVIAAIIFRTVRKERKNSTDKFSESDSELDTIPLNNGSGSP